MFILIIFIHLHLTFVRSPIKCLEFLHNDHSSPAKAKQDDNLETNLSPDKSWLRDTILRVEIIHSPDPSYSIKDSYAKEFYGTEFVDETDSDQLEMDDDKSKLVDLDYIKDQFNLFFHAKRIRSYLINSWNNFLSLPNLGLSNFSEFLIYLTQRLSLYPFYSIQTIDQTKKLFNNRYDDRNFDELNIQKFLNYFDNFWTGTGGFLIKFIVLFKSLISELFNTIGQIIHDLTIWLSNLFAPGNRGCH